MIPIPDPEDHNVSPTNGFLSAEAPLERLPDSYYDPWEQIVKNLQGLLLSGRLHEQVERMPILTTDRLLDEPQWRRAYSLLAFLAHSYIWGGKRPMEWVPPTVTIPFMSVCQHLELPPVATYAGLVLWNWKPIFGAEPTDTLANLDIIDTFTGSLDEKWFYLISVVIEAKGAPLIPLMLNAIKAASRGDRATVTRSLQHFAETLDQLGQLLVRMYEHCDPHIFYHRLRPYLAGSKNMASAGLPNGVIFDNGGPINKQRYVQYSGGSNAQSSLIQFFDIVLGIQHHPAGKKSLDQDVGKKKAAPKSFIHEMREYMPGPHSRFLEAVSRVANLGDFVQLHSPDRDLTIAYDAALAMLSALRDKHIQIVSRYIVIKSHEAKKAEQLGKPFHAMAIRAKPESDKKKKELIGTGGSSLIPFLRQARDETKDAAVNAWTRRLLLGKSNQDGRDLIDDSSKVAVQGLASVWKIDDGGICLV